MLYNYTTLTITYNSNISIVATILSASYACNLIYAMQHIW